MASVRRAFLILVALASGVLCVGSAVMGVRTFYRVTKYEYVSEGTWGWMVIPKNGRVAVLYFRRSADQDPGLLRIRSSPSTTGGTDYGKRFLGFGAGTTLGGGRYGSVPFWFLVLVFAVPPALILRSELRRRRSGPGRCAACGYDLRATPDRCPECGAVPTGVPPTAQAAAPTTT